ncbi:MAG: DUF1987 domain-containing protein [Bacteroidota bacterium]
MIKDLNITGTEDTPAIHYDRQKNVFEISGRSLPEDVVTFYKPVIDWLDDLEKEPISDLEFVFKLDYFNTASSKLILDILLKVNDIFTEGTAMKVKWMFLQMDRDLEEAGEEYSELIEMPFELVAY